MKVQRGEVTCPGSLSLHRGELRFEHETTSKTSALSTTSPGIPAKDPHLSSLCDPLQGFCPQSPDLPNGRWDMVILSILGIYEMGGHLLGEKERKHVPEGYNYDVNNV